MQVIGYNWVGRARCERPGRGRFPKEEPTVGKRIGQRPAMTHLPEGTSPNRSARWRYRCIVCRGSFARPEYSDETKCPKCLADLLAENARGYKPKPRAPRTLQTYGLTQTDYHKLAAKQGGVCAICGMAPLGGAVMHIDHNHSTGVVRGLLCTRCNMGLGAFGDDPKVLSKAAAYLRKRGDYSDFARARAVRSTTPGEGLVDD